MRAEAAEISFAAATSITPVNPGVGDGAVIHASLKNLNDPVADAIVDIEIYKDGFKVYQKFFERQNFGTLETKSYSVGWTPTTAGNYRVKVGVFGRDWAMLYFWKDAGAFFSIDDSGNGVQLPARSIDIWWPTDGGIVSNIQLLKAIVRDMPVGQYEMFWRVDGGQANPMYDSPADWPHKEAMIDFSGWNWNSSGKYTVGIEAKNNSGSVITFRIITVTVVP